MKLPTKAALRAAIPLAIALAFGLPPLLSGQTSTGRSVLASGVIIAALVSGSLIYQVEKWSLPKQSLLHFGMMAVTVLPALFLSDWFPLNTAVDHLILLGSFFGSGVILWTVMYFVSTRFFSGEKESDPKQVS